MVRATLDGRKKMTRRIINPQPIIDHDSGFVFDGKHRVQYGIHNWENEFIDDWSRWMPEDTMWVKESHYRFGSWKKNGLTKTGKQKWRFKPDSGVPNLRFPDDPPIKVQKNSDRTLGWYKRPSLFMPRHAARTWLQVIEIRVERLQEISEEDAITEGIDQEKHEFEMMAYPDGVVETFDPTPAIWQRKNYLKTKETGTAHYQNFSASESFKTLWESINGEESWEQNPWVWVISFKVLGKAELNGV